LWNIIKKKMTVKTYLLIVLLLFGASMVFMQCGSKKKSRKIDVKTPKSEPAFKKEGELAFISSSSEDTLRIINIEIADRDRDRMVGMMFRSKMEYDKGMLFIFDREEQQSFWMKNTKISLDIMYVNSDFEIVTIYKHTQPYSESPIPSFKPAKYVIETAAGFCNEFGIKEGQRIKFKRTEEEVPA